MAKQEELNHVHEYVTALIMRIKKKTDCDWLKNEICNLSVNISQKQKGIVIYK